MPLLIDATEAKKFDVRLTDRHLERGLITQTELNKVTKDLPDDADNAGWVSVDTLAQAADAPPAKPFAAH